MSQKIRRWGKVIVGGILVTLALVLIVGAITQEEEVVRQEDGIIIKNEHLLSAKAYYDQVDYTQNNIIQLRLEEEMGDIKKITVDLEAIGGTVATMSPELLELTIGVRDDTEIGMKTLPIQVVDTEDNTYETSVSFEVVSHKENGDFDWDEAIIYFMLTDRFYNGDPLNDDPYGIGYDKTDRGTYQGGDFRGIIEKLDYLEDLGVNTIWITPIVEPIAYDVRYNADPYLSSYYGYHGYWAKSFESLNPHLGTLEELHELIDRAADRGMKIMVDVVLNHTGYGMDNGSDTPPLHYPTDEERMVFEGMIREEISQDQVTGQLSGLPDFKTEEPAVREKLIDWHVAWVENLAKTPEGNTISFFRVDTVKHVEHETWMALKNELTKIMPTFKMIGEVWGAAAETQWGYLDTGMMDALLDFKFKDLTHALVEGRISEVERKMTAREGRIDNTGTVGNFLSSHDENGFLYSLGYDENKMKTAVSFQMVSKGQPVIYYGEELGHSGQNNYPYYDNRYNMDWSKNHEDNTLLTHYKKLLEIRGAYSDVLAKGDIVFAEEQGDTYLLFEKHYKEQIMYIAINTTNERVEDVTLDGVPSLEQLEDLYSGEVYEIQKDGRVSVTIPPSSEGGITILIGK